MKAYISTSEGKFKCNLTLPRALVLSAVVTIAGAVTEAIRCEMRIQELRAAIAQCQQRPAGAAQEIGTR